jgi:hypothetical protein
MKCEITTIGHFDKLGEPEGFEFSGHGSDVTYLGGWTTEELRKIAEVRDMLDAAYMRLAAATPDGVPVRDLLDMMGRKAL